MKSTSLGVRHGKYGYTNVERFYYFSTNLRASNAYKTAFIEGGKVAFVK